MKIIESHTRPRRKQIYTIIFEAETPTGKLFDVLLITAIIASIVAVCLESMDYFTFNFGKQLFYIEWTFTLLFSLEYFLRIISVRRPLSYITSFYGIIDLLAILPAYLSLYIVGAQSLLVIRSIRILRIFRLFKLARYVSEAEVLKLALKSSRHKVTVFLMVIISIVLFMGSIMFTLEGESSGFTSIPKAMYWAIVTMTTVGYGDLVPQTDLGRAIASFLMIMGYGIIAVPTGIVSVEIANATKFLTTRTCPACLIEGLPLDSNFCRFCGEKL